MQHTLQRTLQHAATLVATRCNTLQHTAIEDGGEVRGAGGIDA